MDRWIIARSAEMREERGNIPRNILNGSVDITERWRAASFDKSRGYTAAKVAWEANKRNPVSVKVTGQRH